MTDTYAQAYAEILEIIKNMEQHYQDKIPVKLIEFFEGNKDSNYQYNTDKINENQNMAFSQKTIDLLAMLQLKYLATEEEKELLKDTLDKNDIKYQTEMREKYNPDNLFKNKNNSSEIIQDNISTEAAIVEYKEKSFIQKLFDKIKYLFRKK
jgi:hypothetical protein